MAGCHGDSSHTLKSPPRSTALVPPALLAAAYMATSAQKDALDAQESPPLPRPSTLMTVSGGHHIQGHGLAQYDVHDVPNFLVANMSARMAFKSLPGTAAADVAWASTPGYT